MADFGVSEKLEEEKAFTKIGTIQYMAPEFFKDNGYDFSVDIWSFGCLMYELVAGFPPFQGNQESEIQHQIETQDVNYRPEFSKDFTDLLQGLLKKNQSKRLTLNQIKEHKFFKKLNWGSVLEKKKKPPIKPTIS